MSKTKWKLRNIKTEGVIELRGSLSRAGRDPTAEIKCNSSLVSRKHANFFILEDGSLRLMDQNTTNGTYVNGKRINEKEIINLQSGDKIALGFDPTVNFEKIANATFYIFEVLAGDQPVPEIIIDSESDSGSAEKTSIEPVRDNECIQEDHSNRKKLADVKSSEHVENSVKKPREKENEESFKFAEPSSSKYSATNDSVASKMQLEIENIITETPTLLKGVMATDNFLGFKRALQKDIHIAPNCHEISIHDDLSDNIVKVNPTDSENMKEGNNIIKNKNISMEQPNNCLKEEYMHKIHLKKKTKLDFKKLETNINAAQDDKNNYSHCIPDRNNKSIEIKDIENIGGSSVKKEQLQDRKELLNKKNKKFKTNSENSNFKNDNCKSDKENKEELLKTNSLKNTNKNRPSKFKGVNVKIKAPCNDETKIHSISLTNKETHDDVTTEENIFQIPTSVSTNCFLSSKRANKDNLKTNTKKMKKDLTEDNVVKHTKSTSSCNENFFNTQELLSVLTDSKEIEKSSNFINNEFVSKGPITRSKSFNEKSKNETEIVPVKMETTVTGFTNEDIIIVDDDDNEDDDSNFPCSQLFQSSQEEEVDIDLAKESNNNNDSLFLNIKKELEELDKTDFVPCIMVDSDIESDWYSDSEKNANVQKVESRRMSDRIVPGTYQNFENNNIDILYYEEAASLNNKSGNEARSGEGNEHEQSLIIEDALENLPPTEETVKNIVSKLGPSGVPTSSFYLSCSSAKKYVIPPIVEPHIVTRARNYNKREWCSSGNELKKQEKKRRPDKTLPKNNSTKKKVEAKTTSQNVQRNSTNRDEIRRKVKEIVAKNTDQTTKELTTKKSAVKIKVSEGRGHFLLENDNHPAKNIRKINKNNVSTKPSVKPLNSVESEATLFENISRLPNKINRSCTSLSSTSSNFKETKKKKGLNFINNMPIHIPNAFSSVEMKVKLDVSDIINQVINWSASWLSQQRNQCFSPSVTQRPPVEMSSKFSTYSDYYNVVTPLLLLELWNSLYKDWSQHDNNLRKTTFCSRIEDEQVVNDCTIMKSFTYINKERHVKGINIKEDDLVVFEVKSRHDNKTILRTGFGFVTFVSKRLVQEKDVVDTEVATLLGLAPDYCVNFTFKTKTYLKSPDNGNIMFVRLVSSMGPYLRLFKSVKYLQFSPLKEMVLNPKVENFKVNKVKSRKLFTNVKLNESQLKAVVKATELCLNTKPGFYLIQGPPGTGKTTVITSIIQEILFSADVGPPRCVLLVAPSNGAVDELVKRLITIRHKLDEVTRKKLKVLRVGPPNSIHPKALCYSLEHMVKMNFLRDVNQIFPQFRNKFLSLHEKLNELDKNCWKTNGDFEQLECAKKEYERICVDNLGRRYFAELEKIRWNCLYNANVICTTLSSCFSTQMEFVFRNSGKITCCIVDEATQSNEQETLIPLMLGLEKIVLVGDPRQLCPTTLSQEAKQLKYGMSLFSRVSNLFEDKPDNPILMLDTQYRMHPEISQFPSKMYYNDRLKNGLMCHRNKFRHLKPYLVFNLAMYCPVEQYRNVNEVTFVIKLLKAIIEVTSATDSVDIGIITPYNNQKIKLNETLKQYKSNVKVTVNTVDSFQGQEKDIIIVSYVRMDGNSFISDEHRLNVALTRAKHALFFVGNKYLFDTCSVLNKIGHNAQKRNMLYIVDDTSSLDLKQIISR